MIAPKRSTLPPAPKKPPFGLLIGSFSVAFAAIIFVAGYWQLSASSAPVIKVEPSSKHLHRSVEAKIKKIGG